MSRIPLLNNETFDFSRDDLPALIHGEKHSGSSLFAITLLAQLYRQGEPILFLSAAEKAKDEFLDQTHSQDEMLSVMSDADVAEAEEKQVIHILKDQESLIPQLFEQLADKNERVVLIKNFEVFSPETLALFYEHPLTIFQGDLNTSEAKEPLLQLKYNAKIFFSPLHNDFRLTLPHLEQYHGYYQGRTAQGTVYLQSDTV